MTTAPLHLRGLEPPKVRTQRCCGMSLCYVIASLCPPFVVWQSTSVCVGNMPMFMPHACTDECSVYEQCNVPRPLQLHSLMFASRSKQRIVLACPLVHGASLRQASAPCPHDQGPISSIYPLAIRLNLAGMRLHAPRLATPYLEVVSHRG